MFGEREQKIVGYLRDRLGESSAHDINHCLRAADYVNQLLQFYPEANRSVALPAILLHDLGREEHISEKYHAVRSAEVAAPLLQGLGYSSQEIDQISAAIIAHDAADETGFYPSLEAKIVHDADRLDGMGAIGVVRIIQYCYEMKFGMEGILERLEKSMPEKIKKIALPEAKEIAEQKYKLVKEFTIRLKAESSVHSV